MRIPAIIIQVILGLFVLLSLGSMYYETEMANRDCSFTLIELQTGKYIQEFSTRQEVAEFLLSNYKHNYRIYKLHFKYQLCIVVLLISLVIEKGIATRIQRNRTASSDKER